MVRAHNFALQAADGCVTHEGWDIVELDAQDKVRRVITFWGALPSTLVS